MQLRKAVIIFCMLSVAELCQQEVRASTFQIEDNGKSARLTLPLKAIITTDSIVRDNITVTPLSSLYEIVKWDPVNQRFRTHAFIVRVSKDKAVPILFEVINDQYTCSYNDPDRMNILPSDIAEVNSGYTYSVSWSGQNLAMGSGRTATVDDDNAWQPSVNGSDRFIDLTLNIVFPDMSSTPLISKGGVCRGNVTMLLSNKL